MQCADNGTKNCSPPSKFKAKCELSSTGQVFKHPSGVLITTPWETVILNDPKVLCNLWQRMQLPWGFWVAANCCLLHWAVLALNTAVNHWEAFAVLTREHFRSSQGPRWNRLSMLCSKTGTRLYTHCEFWTSNSQQQVFPTGLSHPTHKPSQSDIS